MGVTVRAKSGFEDTAVEIEFSFGKVNALGHAALKELSDAIIQASQLKVPFLILCSGGDRSFCAGADLAEFSAARSRADLAAIFRGFADVLLALRAAPQLIVARAQADAVGGGVGFLATADYVIAAKDARVRLSELRIGIGPYVIGPAIERKIGVAHLSTLSIDTEPRSSAWAEHAGLFSQVVADRAELDAALNSFCERFKTTPAESIFQWKQQLWQNAPNWAETLEKRVEHVSVLAESVFLVSK